METDSTLAAIALGVSLISFAVAVLGEASIGSVRQGRVRQLLSQGVPGSAALSTLNSLPMGPMGALTLVKVASFSTGLVSAVAVAIAWTGVNWVAIALVPLAVLVFLGAIHGTARTLAPRYGEPVALRIAVPVRALTWLLNPILSVESTLVRMSLQVAAHSSGGAAQEPVPNEIGLPLDYSREPLDEHEVRMIRGVVQLDKTVAREIMVPRVDMVAAEVETPIAELAEIMVKWGHSRIPVYKGDPDHIEGIAYARDVVNHLLREEDTSTIPVESVVRPALFIPESKTLEELLDEFQQKRMHMAIVVDEYGGVSGLVTIEDLLEEIVGEIRDEFDVSEPQIEAVSDGGFFIDARVSIDELNELLSVSVEGAGFDTLGGFVYHRLGKIPSRGDVVEYDGLKIEVVSTVGRRLKRLKVTRARDLDSAAR